MTDSIKFILLTTLITVFASCSKIPENNNTYFGGKIINPRDNKIVLFYKESPIDTFQLNEENKFLGKIDKVKEGLYYFRHGNEYQYLYLEPKDSILIRLNAWNFDESLVFSGRGAQRNNLLIDCFLDAEKDEKKFFKFYDLNPQEFKDKVDSVEQSKIARYNKFLELNPNISEKFASVLKIAFTFPVYGHIENYSMVHKMKKHNDSHEIPKDFYAYRNQVDIHQDSMMYYSAYRNLVVNHLYNKVHSAGLPMNSDEFTVQLLKTIDSELNDKTYKNTILRQTTLSHFYRKSSCKYSQEVFNTFMNTSDDEEDKELMILLQNDIKQLHAGKKLHSLNAFNYNHVNKSISSLVRGKNAVIYFWNPEYASRENTSRRINYLMNKFPEIEFVGIRIDGDGKDRLKQIDIKEQYYLTSNSEAQKFLTSKLPRTLLVNKKGVLVNGYASIASQSFYSQLKELAKK